jgi:hypothetical protein
MTNNVGGNSGLNDASSTTLLPDFGNSGLNDASSTTLLLLLPTAFLSLGWVIGRLSEKLLFEAHFFHCRLHSFNSNGFNILVFSVSRD